MNLLVDIIEPITTNEKEKTGREGWRFRTLGEQYLLRHYF